MLSAIPKPPGLNYWGGGIQQGCTRTAIIGWCIRCIVWELNPATCDAVYVLFSAKGLISHVNCQGFDMACNDLLWWENYFPLYDNVDSNRTWEYRTGNVKTSARQATSLQVKPNEP
jgi:hypothetical protein